MLLLMALAACGGSTPSATPDAGMADETRDRGPTRLALDGDPNGLWWDATDQVLYVADDNGNRILRWTDEAGFGLAADLPAAGAQGAGLGQVVRTPGGAVVVTRFGFGSAGDVAFVGADGVAGVVPGLDPIRRRIGLTVTADGRLFDSWFVRQASGERVGSVGALELNGREEEVVTGLGKPVGVLALDGALLISDQDLGQILKAPLEDLSSWTVFAEVDAPDLMAVGRDGGLFMGSSGGVVYEVSAAGATAVYASGFRGVRGVAYDAAHRRLFVAEHDPDESDGVSHAVHIVPVD